MNQTDLILTRAGRASLKCFRVSRLCAFFKWRRVSRRRAWFPKKFRTPSSFWASFPPSSSRSCVCGWGGEGGWLFPAFWLAFMRFFRHACMLIWTRIRKRMRV